MASLIFEEVQSVVWFSLFLFVLIRSHSRERMRTVRTPHLSSSRFHVDRPTSLPSVLQYWYPLYTDSMEYVVSVRRTKQYWILRPVHFSRIELINRTKSVTSGFPPTITMRKMPQTPQTPFDRLIGGFWWIFCSFLFSHCHHNTLSSKHKLNNTKFLLRPYSNTKTNHDSNHDSII